MVKFGQSKNNDENEKWKWKSGEDMFEDVDMRCERMVMMIQIQSSNVSLQLKE